LAIRLFEIDYFQYIIGVLPEPQEQKISFKKISAFPDKIIMVRLQMHVTSNAVQFIIINYVFSMLIDIQLTKDFALGAEYDTMNTMRG
jgi:hypothetical protein